MSLKALKRLISGKKLIKPKKVVKKVVKVAKKKPSSVKTRVLTAEGWKRRFGLTNTKKIKKIAKR